MGMVAHSVGSSTIGRIKELNLDTVVRIKELSLDTVVIIKELNIKQW